MAYPAMAASLSDYTNYTAYYIDVSEASAVTYNRDTNTLFTIGDEGVALVQMSLTGQVIDQMTFDNSGDRAQRTLDDPEGLAYMGNGKILIGDERRNVGYLSTYAPGTQVQKNSMPSYAFGPYDGNTGLEGVAYDPVTNTLWGTKEQAPITIYQTSDISAGTNVTVSNPFPGNRFSRAGINSMSDIYMLASSSAFALDDPRRLNLFILARDSKVILEMTREGDLVSKLDISFLGRSTIEGITMDDQGNIYLVAEQMANGVGNDGKSALYVLSAVPEPSTYALIGIASLGAILGYVRKRKLV
jgi:uncharacterized protein YjiK